MTELDYWRNDGYILCPHCNHKIEEVWDYDFKITDGHETNIDCPKCEEVIFIAINVVVKYSSAKYKAR